MGLVLILAIGAVAVPANAMTVSVTSAQYNYPVTGFEAPVNDGKSVYLIGVYEADTDHSQSHVSDVVVDSQNGRPLYLTLSSYEGVDWRFSGSGVADIAGILLTAYTASSVVGVNAALVTSLVGPLETIGYAYEYPGFGATTLINYSANFFGAPVDAFTGTYTANGFAIAAPADATGAIPEPASWAMMIAGFGLVGAATRRQARMASQI